MLQTLLDRLENLVASFGYWNFFLRPWHRDLERLTAELGLKPPPGAVSVHWELVTCVRACVCVCVCVRARAQTHKQASGGLCALQGTRDSCSAARCLFSPLMAIACRRLGWAGLSIDDCV